MVRQVEQFETVDDDFIYPSSDGKPMSDNTIQFSWIVLIKENLEILFAKNPDVFVAGDLLWYPIAKNGKIKAAPDAMVVFGSPKGHRGSYAQAKEGNIPPQVVFEILSPGNKQSEMDDKLDFYNQYGVEEYYLYDPYENNLTGWLRGKKDLKKITRINGWVSPRLDIKFVLTPTTLEIYYPNGQKFLTETEREELRQAAEKRADSERKARLDAIPKLLQAGFSVEEVAQTLSLTVQEVESNKGA